MKICRSDDGGHNLSGLTIQGCEGYRVTAWIAPDGTLRDCLMFGGDRQGLHVDGRYWPAVMIAAAQALECAFLSGAIT